MTTSRDYIRDGAEIYRHSFAIIRREADLSRFSGPEERVAVRIIHACGMVEAAADIQFSPGAALAAILVTAASAQITSLPAGNRERVTPSATIRASHRIGAPH